MKDILGRLLNHYHHGVKKLTTALDPPPSPSPSLPNLEADALEGMLRSEALRLLDLCETITTTTDTEKSHVPHSHHHHHHQRRLEIIERTSHARLYAHRFDVVPRRWRRMYSRAQVLATFALVLESVGGDDDDGGEALMGVVDEVVARLDRGLIIAGGGDGDDDDSGDGGGGGGSDVVGRAWIENAMKVLQGAIDGAHDDAGLHQDVEFSRAEPAGRPVLERPCRRCCGWTLAMFERHMRLGRESAAGSSNNKKTKTGTVPVVFADLTAHAWPALADRSRSWTRPAHLLAQTLGGRRLVPVELGRSYLDDGWGQQLLPFGDFLARHVDGSLRLPGRRLSAEAGTPGEVGYLAQHDLFAQIPSLRNDVLVPDFCWADVNDDDDDDDDDGGDEGDDKSDRKHPPRLNVPLLNAWFGPAGTVTPLHTDAPHNLLCQVVGTKYVRLYPPSAGPLLRPPSEAVDSGVDMSNTSLLDVGLLVSWDRGGVDDDDALQQTADDARNTLQNVPYLECILEPGDTLLIPSGWWHYVRSLSVSFSVSFWWS